MELDQLKYFVTIAETLSFTRAAEILHVSQPALSYQMKRLGDELDTVLFDRKGRKIALSAHGELFLPLAQAVLYRADDAVRVLQEQVGVESGMVRFGCNPSVASNLVPAVLAAFRKDYPRVRVEVVEGGDHELEQSVHTGFLDFAVVTAPGSPQNLDVTPLGTEDLLLITYPSHRFAGRASLDLSELANDDFVLPFHNYNLTAQLIEACRRAGFEPKVACHAGSNESVRNLVRQGLGVTILPSISLTGPNRRGLAVIEVEHGLGRDLTLIRGQDRSLTIAAQVLMAQVSAAVVKNMRHAPAGGPAVRETGSGVATGPEEKDLTAGKSAWPAQHGAAALGRETARPGRGLGK